MNATFFPSRDTRYALLRPIYVEVTATQRIRLTMAEARDLLQQLQVAIHSAEKVGHE